MYIKKQHNSEKYFRRKTLLHTTVSDPIINADIFLQISDIQILQQEVAFLIFLSAMLDSGDVPGQLCAAVVIESTRYSHNCHIGLAAYFYILCLLS